MYPEEKSRPLSKFFSLLRAIFDAQPVLCTVIVLCIASLLAFSKLASEMVEGEGRAIDTQILLAMRSANDITDPLGPPWFEDAMRDITALGSVAILTFITMASAIYLFCIKKKGVMLYLLTAVGTGALVGNLLKTGFARPRPDLVPHEVLVNSASFPSGHALLATIVYMTLGAVLAEHEPQHGLKIYILSLGIILTIAVGISRIYLGVHWPSDVLAGWLGGSAWAFMCWAIAHVVKR